MKLQLSKEFWSSGFSFLRFEMRMVPFNSRFTLVPKVYMRMINNRYPIPSQNLQISYTSLTLSSPNDSTERHTRSDLPLDLPTQRNCR